jgi:hypothetical protein
MQQNLNEALGSLKKLGTKQSLSPAEKELVQLLTNAFRALDQRLVALEGTNQAPTAPIQDTPQGETAPLSR